MLARAALGLAVVAVLIGAFMPGEGAGEIGAKALSEGEGLEEVGNGNGNGNGGGSSQLAVDLEASFVLVDIPRNIRSVEGGLLVGLDGGYANVTVEAAKFYSIDPEAPTAAVELGTLYGPSGEGGWYGYDGFGASQNAGPGETLVAFVAEDWDTGEWHRLELHLLSDDGTVLDSEYVLELQWAGWSGDPPDGYPWIAKVYRWGDVNLVAFLGATDTSDGDGTWVMAVSTEGGTITAGAPVLIGAPTRPAFSFVAASDTDGAVNIDYSGTWSGFSFINNPDAEVVQITRSGLSISIGNRSTYFVGTGWPNGIAHHAGDVYIVFHESYTDPEFGNSLVARAVSAFSGVITSIAMPSGSGGTPYLNLQNNNLAGDSVVNYGDGFASIWSAFAGNYVDRLSFDGSSLTHLGTTTGQPRTTSGRETPRTAKLVDGWLSVAHDKYWVWSDDFSSVLDEGAFTNLRDPEAPSGVNHFPTQLPDLAQ